MKFIEKTCFIRTFALSPVVYSMFPHENSVSILLTFSRHEKSVYSCFFSICTLMPSRPVLLFTNENSASFCLYTTCSIKLHYKLLQRQYQVSHFSSMLKLDFITFFRHENSVHYCFFSTCILRPIRPITMKKHCWSNISRK